MRVNGGQKGFYFFQLLGAQAGWVNGVFGRVAQLGGQDGEAAGQDSRSRDLAHDKPMPDRGCTV